MSIFQIKSIRPDQTDAALSLIQQILKVPTHEDIAYIRGHIQTLFNKAAAPPDNDMRLLGCLIAAAENGRAVGTIQCGLWNRDKVPEDEGRTLYWLFSLAVAPDWQGRGVGSALLVAAEDLARRDIPSGQNGRLHLVDETEKYGKKSHFYKKRGYQDIGTYNDYPYMIKDITPAP